jgi:hypothetical protein
MRGRKLEEIRRMEIAKEKLIKELNERQRILNDEYAMNEQIKYMKDDINNR